MSTRGFELQMFDLQCSYLAYRTIKLNDQGSNLLLFLCIFIGILLRSLGNLGPSEILFVAKKFKTGISKAMKNYAVHSRAFTIYLGKVKLVLNKIKGLDFGW